MVLQIQLGFESPVIAASLTLFSVHSTGTISPLHRPAICYGLFRHPCREESAPYRRISCGDGTWSTRGGPFPARRIWKPRCGRGRGSTCSVWTSVWLARAAWSLPGSCGPGTRGRESFLSPPQQRIFEGGLSGHPIQYLFKPVRREELAEAPEADLRQRQVPRTLTLRGSGRALRNGIDGGMARVNLRGQPGQPFPISSRWRCCPRPTPRWRLIDAQPHAGVPWTGGQPGQSHHR